MGGDYSLGHLETQSQEKLQELAAIATATGLEAQIGG